MMSFLVNLSFASSQEDISAILGNKTELETFAKSYGKARKALNKINMHLEFCARKEDQALDSAIDIMKKYEDSIKKMSIAKKSGNLMYMVFLNTIIDDSQEEQEIDCWKNLKVIFDFSLKYDSFFKAMAKQPHVEL